jgi:hypothetical protein
VTLRNKLIFYYDELLSPRPTTKLEDHNLSAVCYCVFNVFATSSISGGRLLHPQPEDAPCRGEKGPKFMEPLPVTVFKYVPFTFLLYVLYAPIHIDRVVSKLCFQILFPNIKTFPFDNLLIIYWYMIEDKYFNF